jgi:hypothetical protein
MMRDRFEVSRMMIPDRSAYQRMLFTIFGLLAMLLLPSIPTPGQNTPANTQAATHKEPETIVWNISNHNAPLLVAPELSHSSLDFRLAYPGEDFALPFLQILYYEAQADIFALVVRLPKSQTLQILHLHRLPAGNTYRSANGPSLELEDSGDMKVITSANKTRFLFAIVGDGEWRCVAIHDPFGNYLLIDYRPDGLIARLRDSFSRSVDFNLREGRISFLASFK